MSMWRDFKGGFSWFGHNIVFVVNTALLTIVYLIGVGPTWFISRIVGKKFLDLKQSKKSYWSALNLKKMSKDSYYRQF